MAAGGNIGEESDNPVGINITAMVDIIFCLCLFFMCSLHFKQVEGKIDSWMPKDRGVNEGEIKPQLEEIRIFMKWDHASSTVIRKVGSRNPVANDEELLDIIRANIKDYARLGKTEVPVVVDSTDAVPWKDVVHLLDLCKKEGLSKINFAGPMEFKR